MGLGRLGSEGDLHRGSVTHEIHRQGVFRCDTVVLGDQSCEQHRPLGGRMRQDVLGEEGLEFVLFVPINEANQALWRMEWQ